MTSTCGQVTAMKFLFLECIGIVATVLLLEGTAAFLSLSTTCLKSSTARSRRLIAHSSTQTSLVNIDETAARDISTMEEWAYTCGAQTSGGFQFIGETIDGDLNLDVSLTTSEDIPSGTSVLYVPHEMILSSSKAIEEFGRLEEAEALIASNNAENQLPHYYLMLKILYEYQQGDQSPWFPYLNSLPRYFSNAASMTPFCYKCIPPLVASLAKQERANLNHLTAVKRAVPFLSTETKCNAELWVWAFQIVYTRSFATNDNNADLKIVPMADYLNHATEPNIADFSYDEEGNCYVQTLTDVPAGSPLCMSYGDATNPSHLFARYGFLDEEAPATFCKYIPKHVNEEMITLGYAHNQMLFYKDTGEVSEQVWDILLYQFLTDSQDLSTRQAFYEAHVNGDFETKQALHDHYYSATYNALKEHVESFLNQLQELSAKTLNRSIKEHPRLPLIVRHNEFVERTFLAVQSRLLA